MFLQPLDIMNISEQRRVARRARAARARLARFGKPVYDQPEHASHRLHNVVMLSSPSGHDEAYRARVA